MHREAELCVDLELDDLRADTFLNDYIVKHVQE